MSKIYNKNIANEEYQKLKDCLFKMRELNQIVLGTGLIASIKWHLDDPEGREEVKYPLTDAVFSPFSFKLGKKFFFLFRKGTFLPKYLIPGRFIFLKYS